MSDSKTEQGCSFSMGKVAADCHEKTVHLIRHREVQVYCQPRCYLLRTSSRENERRLDRKRKVPSLLYGRTIKLTS